MAIRSFVLAAAAALGLAAAAPAAEARGSVTVTIGPSWGYGYGYGHGHPGFGYGQPSWGYGHRGRGWGHRKHHQRRVEACHAVTYRDYVQGRPALIGATQCYDGYGRAYIVRGSGRVIQWYAW